VLLDSQGEMVGRASVLRFAMADEAIRGGHALTCIDGTLTV